MTGRDVHDVVVVGAGPAGTAAASTMRHAGLDVAMVAPPVDGHARRAHVGQTAPPGTDRVVADIFCIDAFDPGAHLRSLGNRSSWGSDDLGDTDFMFNPFGTGWHLDRAAFDRGLLESTLRRGVALVPGAVTASRRAANWVLDVRDGTGRRELAAQFVVDASGRRAVVARAHGAQIVRDDRLVAAVAVVTQPVDTRDHWATVDAVPEGWWYSAPVPGAGQVLSFFTDPELHEPGALSERGWFARAAHRAPHLGRFADQFERATSVSPVVVAAGTTRLSTPFGEGWLAAGDAAATFDPLSSQGVLTALLSGRAAGDAAVAVLTHPGPTTSDAPETYGDIVASVVADYERERTRWYQAETRFAGEPFWTRRCETRSHSY